MPLKRYGIYLAYAPTVDMRAEGLGRHLAALLKAASTRPDLRFVVVCPSWTRESIIELCESEAIDVDSFDLVAPRHKPALLRVYQRWQRSKLRRRRPLLRWWKAYFAWILRRVGRVTAPWRRLVIGSRSVIPLVVFGVVAAVLAVVAAPFVLGWALLQIFGPRVVAFGRRVALRGYIAVADEQTKRAAKELIAGRSPKHLPGVVGLYRQMQDVEIDAMHRLIRSLPEVRAWYCPTAFWPSVTRLDRPQLICVPDVVLTDFAASFSELGGDRLLETFRQIERTLSSGQRFVTYSEYVKHQTLVRRFGVPEAAIDVITHGAIRLDPLIMIQGSVNPAAATDAFCRDILDAAVRRSLPGSRRQWLGRETRFLFYASQFRPHKNIANLVRACEHLLRRRHRGYRLVLTGNPQMAPEVVDVAKRLGFSDEILFLHQLTPQELAACYRLASVSVNPSLFEGGLPFTFSESVSVGTPVVMSRIPVTIEAIDDTDLLRDMLFDPQDWRDIASRIEWALGHRAELLERQRAFYERRIVVRTWDDALDDYVAALDRLAEGEPRALAA
jgi:hypothetical protein